MRASIILWSLTPGCWPPASPPFPSSSRTSRSPTYCSIVHAPPPARQTLYRSHQHKIFPIPVNYSTQNHLPFRCPPPPPQSAHLGRTMESGSPLIPVGMFVHLG